MIFKSIVDGLRHLDNSTGEDDESHHVLYFNEPADDDQKAILDKVRIDSIVIFKINAELKPIYSCLAQAIAHQACLMQHKSRYFSTTGFFDEAKLAKLEGSWPALFKKLGKTDLIILDDFGLHPMQPDDRHLLMDLIEARHGKASTIVCSQIPVSGWHQLIGEATIADAILDRLVYSSHRLQLKGESLRKKQRLTP